MNKNQLTSYHLFCFVYIGFADLTNEKITKNVIEEIERKVAQWMSVDPTNIVEFNRIIQETYSWYNGLSEDNHLNTLLEVAKAINQLEDITFENKKTFLSDIRDIAVADGRFNETEKHMHDIIARELGINVMTTDKDIKKKIGF